MTKWKDRVRRGTVVEVPAMKVKVLNTVGDEKTGVRWYRCTILDDELGEAFWTSIPSEYIET